MRYDALIALLIQREIAFIREYLSFLCSRSCSFLRRQKGDKNPCYLYTAHVETKSKQIKRMSRWR